jgi:23S rRNA (uracil-5-)-methyltransferase RumA
MSASLSSTPSLATARCRHFGACGGCALQDRPYEEQVALKAQKVQSLLSPLGVAVGQVHPSPETWFYRNKMEFSFGDVYPPTPGSAWLKLGLKPKGKWYEILDLEECFLLSKETPALLDAARQWALRERVAPFNSHKQTGFLRHLVVREAKNGPDRMVVAVTTPGAMPEGFVSAVQSAYPATTILHGGNAKKSDTAISDSLEVLSGPGFITERLRFGARELTFRISPHSFFQTNTRATELLYGRIRAWLGGARPARVLDLYCGGGGIALAVADVCGEVVGAEINASAIEDAKANAALNGIASANFYCGAVEALLPSLLAMKPEAVIVDPPRCGLHPKALAALLELGAPRLIYVSCNPKALVNDLTSLLTSYSVENCEVFDLFPHTEHVETLVALRAKA